MTIRGSAISDSSRSRRHRLLPGVAALLVLATLGVCTLPDSTGPESLEAVIWPAKPEHAPKSAVASVVAAPAHDLVVEGNRGDVHARARLCSDAMLSGEQTGNYADAAYWCALAAEAGDAQAQADYARLFQLGSGVAQDDAQAALWYDKAVEQQNAHAMYMRGRMLMAGDDAADNAYGLALLKQAATRGDANARWALQNLGETPEERRGQALVR